MDKVRCTACRGSKKVAKLGGMSGDCNLCGGSGLINQSDKPVAVVVQPVEAVADIISQVSNVVPNVVAIDDKPASTKTNSKKAIYKRKHA